MIAPFHFITANHRLDMHKYIFSVVLVLLIGLSGLHAQRTSYQWRLRLGVGATQYLGDLSYRYQDDWEHYANLPPEAQPYAANLWLERRLSRSFSLGLTGQYGFITGTDRLRDLDGNLITDNPNLARSLNFRSEIYGGQLMLTFRTDNGWLLRKQARLAPYLFVGFGATAFDVYGDLFDADGQRYYYWSDQTIRNLAEGDPNAADAALITQDGDFETRLTNLETEQDGAYDPFAWQVPAGIGLDLRLTSRLRLGLQYQLTYTFTDYLDDVSGNYKTDFAGENAALAAYASNPGDVNVNATTLRGDGGGGLDQDWYGMAMLTLSIDFGVRLRKFRPVYFYADDRVPSREDSMLMLIDPLEALTQEEAADTLAAAGTDSSTTDTVMVAAADSMAADSSAAPAMAATDSVATDSMVSMAADTAAVDSSVAADSTQAAPLPAAAPSTVTNHYYYFFPNGGGATPAMAPVDTTAPPASTTAAPRDTVAVPGDTVLIRDTVSLAPDTVTLRDTVLQEKVVRDTVTQVQRELVRDTVTVREVIIRDTASGDTVIIREQRGSRRDRMADSLAMRRMGQEMERLRREQERNYVDLQQRMAALQTAVESDRLERRRGEVDQAQRRINELERKVADQSQEQSPVAADPATAAEMALLRQQVAELRAELRVRPRPLAYASRGEAAPESAVPKPTTTASDSAASDSAASDSSLAYQYQPPAQPDTAARPALRARPEPRPDTVMLRDTLVLRDTVVAPPAKPDTVVEKVSETKFVEMRQASIFFRKGSSELFAADMATLSSVVSNLKANPDLAVRIAGFADKSGTSQVNQRLSQERAEKVSAYLQENGIAADRINVQYFGDERTRYEEGALDRRVEIDVYRP